MTESIESQMMSQSLIKTDAWKDNFSWGVVADSLEEQGIDASSLRSPFTLQYITYHTYDRIPIRHLPDAEKATHNGGFGHMEDEFSGFINDILLRVSVWRMQYYQWTFHGKPDMIIMRCLPEKSHGFYGWTVLKLIPKTNMPPQVINIIRDVFDRPLKFEFMEVPSYWRQHYV